MQSIKTAIEGFEKLDVLGEGTYGTVYRARNRATGEIVALKKTKFLYECDGVPSTTLREISILKMLSGHPHVIKYVCIYISTSTRDLIAIDLVTLMDVKQGVDKNGEIVRYLVFEYMETDLRKFIKTKKENGDHIPPEIIKSLMYQLCKGVAFCHSHGVLHRDLKPDNLLMDQNASILKIADFGLARSFALPLKEYTPEYKAPEVLLGATHYSTAVDMWAVGCIFGTKILYKFMRSCVLVSLYKWINQPYGLLFYYLQLNWSKVNPYLPEKLSVNCYSVFSGTPNEEIWPGVSKLKRWDAKDTVTPFEAQPISTLVPNLDGDGIDLITRMLEYEPSKRISAKRAMEHPYFDDLDKT
ncbi:hypothetical protein SSX86_004391 [Deinandra increscens subsp. villosa]|uniref:Protein kinase domain-containing protein n=1 Tax=Deinandra increscens subsp. villosa TaxID=3103831 RepID=A0AAP0DS05_9ASTR